jgi:hypothetical protein
MRQAVWVNPPDDDNAILRCPECDNEGDEMSHFSFLTAGMNGIKSGDPDDLDCLECGECAAKLEFPEGL